MSTQGKGTYLINSGWSSGTLVFYEKAVGRTATGDIFTIGTTAVTIGGTAQDCDFAWYATGSKSFVLDAGAGTMTLAGLDVSITGDLTIDTEDIALGDNDSLEFGDAADMSITWNATNLAIIPATDNTGEIQFGNDGTKSMDVRFYGATASYNVLWDMNGDTNGAWLFGADTKGILTQWYGDTASYLVKWDPSGDTNGAWYFGANDYGVDVLFYGVTASCYAQWDASADSLLVVRTSAATTGTITSFNNALTLTGAGASLNSEAGISSLTVNAAAGNWVNALVSRLTFGASGRTTGIAASFCPEMTLSAGCTQGSYFLIEGELIMGAGASTGAATGYINLNVSGDGKAAFDDNGFLFDFQGVAPASGKFILLDGDAPADYNEKTVYIKCRCNTTTFYLLGMNAAATVD